MPGVCANVASNSPQWRSFGRRLGGAYTTSTLRACGVLQLIRFRFIVQHKTLLLWSTRRIKDRVKNKIVFSFLRNASISAQYRTRNDKKRKEKKEKEEKKREKNNTDRLRYPDREERRKKKRREIGSGGGNFWKQTGILIKTGTMPPRSMEGGNGKAEKAEKVVNTEEKPQLSYFSQISARSFIPAFPGEKERKTRRFGQICRHTLKIAPARP